MNVLISGTSTGIGHALSMEFLEHGSTVYGISRKFNDKFKDYEGYHHLSHDLLKLDEMPGKLTAFLKGVKTLDLVILNASILLNLKEIRKTPIDEITTVMRVNVWANKVIIDTLLEKIPSVYQVVAISCGSFISNAREFNAYSLSKLALNKMIKFYSEEIPGTHFSSLAPGLIDSNLQEHISRLPDDDNYSIIRELRSMRENGQMANPYYAANYMVEAMGTVLQEDSGSYKDVKDLLLMDSEGVCPPNHYSTPSA